MSQHVHLQVHCIRDSISCLLASNAASTTNLIASYAFCSFSSNLPCLASCSPCMACFKATDVGKSHGRLPINLWHVGTGHLYVCETPSSWLNKCCRVLRSMLCPHGDNVTGSCITACVPASKHHEGDLLCRWAALISISCRFTSSAASSACVKRSRSALTSGPRARFGGML